VPTRVAINGFGRIGRSFFRAVLAKGSPLQVVAVNDLASPLVLANLLKYDSIAGRLGANVEASDHTIVVNGMSIAVLEQRDPATLPWADLGIDVVIESTGRFTHPVDARRHLAAGARKVIVSAPVSGDDIPTIVLGVNEETYDPAHHDVISNASCTTNCLAPLAKVFLDHFGIESGLMTTVHAFTQDQNLHDGPHVDPRRARAATLSIIPTSSGAGKALGHVIPELAGKLAASSLRVPVPTGSLTELTVRPTRPATIGEIHAAYREAANGSLKGILAYTEDSIVSVDVVGDPHSAVFDAGLTMVVDGQARVSAWYDNEWGFSNRLVELAELVGQRLPHD
jgi:glyceraldehyde 3-phosphate dehydrogenase